MTRPAQDSSLGAFVLRIAAWLGPAFLVWYAAGAIFAWPIALLTEAVTRVAFGDIVRSVEQHGYTIIIVSKLSAGAVTTQSLAGGVVTVALNTLLYSFGFPMLAALTLAARQGHAVRTLALGYLLLAPFITWGIVAEFLKHVAFDTAATIASQTGFGPVQRETIAFAYQFGALILPTVAPAVFWVLTHRRFLERFVVRDRFGALSQ